MIGSFEYFSSGWMLNNFLYLQKSFRIVTFEVFSWKLCLTENTLNGTCATTTECAANLICFTGKCQCQPGDYYWNGYMCDKSKLTYI